jgi:hypothetical protein
MYYSWILPRSHLKHVESPAQHHEKGAQNKTILFFRELACLTNKKDKGHAHLEVAQEE